MFQNSVCSQCHAHKWQNVQTKLFPYSSLTPIFLQISFQWISPSQTNRNYLWFCPLSHLSEVSCSLNIYGISPFLFLFSRPNNPTSLKSVFHIIPHSFIGTKYGFCPLERQVRNALKSKRKRLVTDQDPL